VEGTDIDFEPLAQRATEIVGQLRDGDWDRLRVDWDDLMREQLTVAKLGEVWQQLQRDGGALRTIGCPVVRRTGLYRVAEMPLVFEHGQMKARVVFNRHDAVAGLFILLPDAD
jgi:hypothetical protein